MHIVEIPTDAYNKHSPCRYKYSVFSDAVREKIMKTSFEFISGITKDGKIIDRLLVLDGQYVKKESKLI